MNLAKRNRVRLVTVLGAVAMAVAGGVVFATPASAGTHCESGYHCVFWNDNFTGARHRDFNTDANFTDDTVNDTTFGTDGDKQVVNDNSWSVSNSTSGGYYSKYYQDINYGGQMLFCLQPGHSLSGLQNRFKNGVPYSDVSSFRLTSVNPGGCF